MTPRSGERVPELDGVRGLAILIVFVGHVAIFGAPGETETTALWRVLARHAGTGVDLFFVLSGFLITGILYDARQSQRYFRNFYIRRTLRIFPLYYAVLAALVIAKLVFPHVYALESMSPMAQLTNWTYTSNILVALKGWGSQPGYLAHFWSLAVEEQFYLLWPVAVWRFDRRRLLLICLAAIVVAPIFRVVFLRSLGFEPAYTLLPARMDSLLVGGAIALGLRSSGGLPRWLKHPGIVAGAIALYIADVAWTGPLHGVPGQVRISLHFTLTSLVFGLLIASLLTTMKDSHVRSLFRHRLLRFFGKYSYSIYIVHVAVIVFLPGLIRRVASLAGAPPLPMGRVTLGALALATSVGIALLTWRVIEQPFLRLKDRLAPPHAFRIRQ